MNIKEKLKHPLVQGSSIVLVGNLLASFFSYLYHFVTGRLLSPSEYGLLESMIALTYFLGVLTQSFSFTVINTLSRKKDKEVLLVVRFLKKKAVVFSLYAWIILLFLYPFLKSFLHFENNYTYFLFSLYAFFAFLPALYLSGLQARLKFLAFSGLTVLQSIFKVFLAWFFIFLGLKALGAFSAFIWQGALSIFIGAALINKYWPRGKKQIKAVIKENIWSFLGLSLLSNMALASIYSSDILLVRHYFPPFQVGIYSAGAVLSKMIFFGASAVLLVSFPLFSKYKNNFLKLEKIFLTALIYILLVCLTGVLVFKLFPSLIVQMLYGGGYQEAAEYLFLLAIFISLAALLNLVVQFLLALKKWEAAFLAVMAASLQIVLIALKHTDLKTIIINSIISTGLALILGAFIIRKKLYAKEK